MNGVIGMTELLLDTALDGDQRELAETIQFSADALLGIINDVLDFSKIEAGKLDLECVPFDVQRTIAEVVALLDSAAEQKGLPLVTSIARRVVTRRMGDPGRLRQVILNLMGNAVKFTASGQVTVVVDVDPERPDALRFEVRDTGIGIPAESLPHLFEAFAQADASTSRRFGGTGLGLAICKRLVELMGGEIGVESEPGQGSTFWFTARLPRAVETAEVAPTAWDAGTPTPVVPAVPEPAASEAPAPAAEAPPWSEAVAAHAVQPPLPMARPTRPGRVLVAEDSKINQRVVLGMLERLGYAADVVENGAEALTAIEQMRYAAVLMDCQMPVMDGLTATSEIRRREQRAAASGEQPAAERPRLPIIAITANALAGDRERCLDAGMDDFLPKPLRGDALAAVLRRWVAEQGPVVGAARPAEATVAAAGPARPVAVPHTASPIAAPGVSSPIDLAAIERLRAVQADVVGELIEIFVQQAPTQIETLRAAAASGQYALLRRTAHTMRGDAAAWGASDLERRCGEVEHLTDDEARAGCNAPLAALEQELGRVVGALRTLGAQAQSVA
jgi:CheY-like chemotaxis protein/HPt (histidine-containing phosphotransfer) domain-containing protein